MRRARNQRRARLGLAVLAVVLGIAGCGSASTSAESPKPAGTSPSAISRSARDTVDDDPFHAGRPGFPFHDKVAPRANDVVTVTFARGTTTMNTKVTLGEQPG